MEKHTFVLVMFCALTIVLVPCSKSGSPNTPASSASSEDDAKFVSSWLYKELKIIEKIKVGSTRADLLKVFKEAGGISTRAMQHFLHRKCPYITVYVEFEPVVDKEKAFDYHPTDRITKISEPHLKSMLVSD